MQRQLTRAIPNKPKCENNANKVTPVGFVEIKPALFMLLIGNGLALLIFFIEIIIMKISKLLNKSYRVPHYRSNCKAIFFLNK